MCIICIEIMNNRMTLLEADRALREIRVDNEDEHLEELHTEVLKELTKDE